MTQAKVEPRLHTIAMTVNGKHCAQQAEPRQVLVYLLEEQLG